ncbi:MAG: DUF819 family protein [Candidatus Izimaplasma sp.]|nr:DUF819 family protein [Candidatus Izimaplasma bacterium]
MITAILQFLVILIIPLLILKYKEFVLTKLIGSIGMAYLLGIIVALIIFLINKLGIMFILDEDVGQITSHLAISIAIPLLLFSSNLKEVKKLSKVVLLSFGLLVVSAVVVSSIAFFFYGQYIENGATLSGMAIGLYTGGTPNLNAIGKIFSLDTTIIAVANLSDMMIGAVFYIFLLILAKPLLSLFLKKDHVLSYMTEDSELEEETEYVQKFKLNNRLIKMIALSFIFVVVSALFGLMAWFLLGKQEGSLIDILVPSMMIGVTIFGIIGSFNKKIRETKHLNFTGQYFILVFSFALASSINLLEMTDAFGSILVLYSVITLGVFLLHTFFSYLLKINVDCMIVTLTAGLYGPAFIPAITKQIKNDKLTAPGLIIGSLGYAIGTFLGMILIFLYAI